MSWIDDLQMRVAQAKQYTTEIKESAAKYIDIGQYIASLTTEATVKSGEAAKGNLTQAQLDAGIRGSTGEVPSSNQNNPASMNANPNLAFLDSIKNNMLLVGLATALGVYFFMKKGK